MRPMPIRLACTLVLTAGSAAPVWALEKGDSPEQVRAELGRPLGELVSGNAAIWLYPTREITLVDDVVAGITPRKAVREAAAPMKVTVAREDKLEDPEAEAGEPVVEEPEPAPVPEVVEEIPEEEPWPPPGISKRHRQKMLRAGKDPQPLPMVNPKIDMGEKFRL